MLLRRLAYAGISRQTPPLRIEGVRTKSQRDGVGEGGFSGDNKPLPRQLEHSWLSLPTFLAAKNQKRKTVSEKYQNPYKKNKKRHLPAVIWGTLRKIRSRPNWGHCSTPNRRIFSTPTEKFPGGGSEIG